MGIFDLVKLPWLFRSQGGATRLDLDNRLVNNIPSCSPQTYDYTERHYPRNGSMVYGYPSTGGIIVRSARPVEVVHLGLDRFKDTKRSTNADEEYEFCKRLGRIGAQWWASKAEYIDAQLGEGGSAASIKLTKKVETGWPSSGQGVWILVYDQEDRDHYQIRRGASLLNKCLNMDERCKIIEELGGTLYSDPDDIFIKGSVESAAWV